MTREDWKHIGAMLLGQLTVWLPTLWYINKIQQEHAKEILRMIEEHSNKF